MHFVRMNNWLSTKSRMTQSAFCTFSDSTDLKRKSCFCLPLNFDHLLCHKWISFVFVSFIKTTMNDLLGAAPRTQSAIIEFQFHNLDCFGCSLFYSAFHNFWLICLIWSQIWGSCSGSAFHMFLYFQFDVTSGSRLDNHTGQQRYYKRLGFRTRTAISEMRNQIFFRLLHCCH